MPNSCFICTTTEEILDRKNLCRHFAGFMDGRRWVLRIPPTRRNLWLGSRVRSSCARESTNQVSFPTGLALAYITDHRCQNFELFFFFFEQMCAFVGSKVLVGFLRRCRSPAVVQQFIEHHNARNHLVKVPTFPEYGFGFC